MPALLEETGDLNRFEPARLEAISPAFKEARPPSLSRMYRGGELRKVDVKAEKQIPKLHVS